MAEEAYSLLNDIFRDYNLTLDSYNRTQEQLGKGPLDVIVDLGSLYQRNILSAATKALILHGRTLGRFVHKTPENSRLSNIPTVNTSREFVKVPTVPQLRKEELQIFQTDGLKAIKEAAFLIDVITGFTRPEGVIEFIKKIEESVCKRHLSGPHRLGCLTAAR